MFNDGYSCRWLGGVCDYCLYHDMNVDAMECAEDCFEYEEK